MVPMLRRVKKKLNRSVQFGLDGARPATPHIEIMTDATATISLPAETSPKRRLVLEAAADLFMEHGYEKVSMDAVARGAGVSKATLYAHFASKDALFASIVGEACQRNTAPEGSFPAEVTDIRAALTVIGERVLRFLLQPGTQAIYRVAVADSARCPELGRAFMANGPQRFLDRFSIWLAAQTAAGHLAVTDPLMAAEQFGALLRLSLFMRVTLGLAPECRDPEVSATVAAAVDTFMKAFGRA